MKRVSDVQGYLIRCPDFIPCPICYGCRNFNPRYQKCLDNCGTYKDDVCKTKVHRDDILAKMLEKQHVTTEGED